MIKRGILCVFALGIVIAAVSSVAAQPINEKAAVSAAEKWLLLVDQGNYNKSWNEAALYFRNAVKPERWQQAAQAVRKPLGKLVSRKMKSSTYATSLPGAPDGKYVVIKFTTSFANKKSSLETVTTMLDKDGQWRVCGYFIR